MTDRLGKACKDPYSVSSNEKNPLDTAVVPDSGLFTSGRSGQDILSLHEMKVRNASFNRQSVADLAAVLTKEEGADTPGTVTADQASPLAAVADTAKKIIVAENKEAVMQTFHGETLGQQEVVEEVELQVTSNSLIERKETSEMVVMLYGIDGKNPPKLQSEIKVQNNMLSRSVQPSGHKIVSDSFNEIGGTSSRSEHPRRFETD